MHSIYFTFFGATGPLKSFKRDQNDEDEIPSITNVSPHEVFREEIESRSTENDHTTLLIGGKYAFKTYSEDFRTEKKGKWEALQKSMSLISKVALVAGLVALIATAIFAFAVPALSSEVVIIGLLSSGIFLLFSLMTKLRSKQALRLSQDWNDQTSQVITQLKAKHEECQQAELIKQQAIEKQQNELKLLQTEISKPFIPYLKVIAERGTLETYNLQEIKESWDAALKEVDPLISDIEKSIERNYTSEERQHAIGPYTRIHQLQILKQRLIHLIREFKDKEASLHTEMQKPLLEIDNLRIANLECLIDSKREQIKRTRDQEERKQLTASLMSLESQRAEALNPQTLNKQLESERLLVLDQYKQAIRDEEARNAVQYTSEEMEQCLKELHDGLPGLQELVESWNQER